MSTHRVLAWFSCGAASAVAAKVAVMRYGDACEVCYCDTSADEHPDNARFFADIERWLGRAIKRLRSPKYARIDDVFLGERFIIGQRGAPCTRILKRHVRESYQRPGDIHVLGFTADEGDRMARFRQNFPDLQTAWVLQGIAKPQCFSILQAAGIELPAMYKLGYRNANCLGCVKGGAGYWNKIRRDFPDVFRRRALVEREIGHSILRINGKPVFLDELPPNSGRMQDEPDIECGLWCSANLDLLVEAVNATPAQETTQHHQHAASAAGREL